MKLSWDEYFMGVAQMVSMRSEDPKTKVGCVLVKNNKIIGTGYNGFPKSVDFFWYGEGIEDKSFYVVHAEANALLNTTVSAEGAVAYVTLFPCNECAKLLIQAGIKKIVYLADTKHDKPETVASRMLLTSAKIDFVQYDGRNININID
jgi:dCMP deaminase